MQVVGLVLMGLGVIVLVVAIWSWRRRRDGPPHRLRRHLKTVRRRFRRRPEGIGPPARDVPTFRVVALGVEGAGKTVLLASQYHRLTPTAGRPYFLYGGLEQDLVLSALHTQVRDTSAPWPPGTRKRREFLFDCKAFDRARDQRTVFRISYLDYPGEIFEPGHDWTATAAELEDGILDAHALLVIIDGRRVLQLLKDERAGLHYFDSRLMPLLGLAHRASCPVQLIITKWDLVRSFDGSTDDDELLRQVSRRLMAYRAIKQLVDAHCRRLEEVRLIPVSAVGPHFADLHDDGTVVKRADGMLDPINVDVPLCAVIPDVLKRVEQSLDPSDRKTLDDEIRRAPSGDVRSIVRSVLDSEVGKQMRLTLASVVGGWVVALFVDLLVRSTRRGVQPPPDDDDDAETQRLRAEVIHDMEGIVEDFEDRLSSSILCRRRLR